MGQYGLHSKTFKPMHSRIQNPAYLRSLFIHHFTSSLLAPTIPPSQKVLLYSLNLVVLSLEHLKIGLLDHFPVDMRSLKLLPALEKPETDNNGK